ncbi:MAG TPA: hypothetical protein GXX60_00305 [Anaerolineaceae bacterium]|nr:hypothetical protein [Anaerolineaceae bacterium]
MLYQKISFFQRDACEIRVGFARGGKLADYHSYPIRRYAPVEIPSGVGRLRHELYYSGVGYP